MKKFQIMFAVWTVGSLGASPARALIRPEVETHCRSGKEAGLHWEMNLVFERLHPMAGVHLFGLARLDRGDQRTLFQVEAHPHYSEFTVSGLAAEPHQRMETQKYLLTLQDTFLEPGRSTPATLEIRTDSGNPFGKPTVEKLELDCVSVELKKN